VPPGRPAMGDAAETATAVLESCDGATVGAGRMK